MAKDDSEEKEVKGGGGSGAKTFIIAIVVLIVGIGLGYLTATMLVDKSDSSGPVVKTKAQIPDSIAGLPNYDQVKLENIVINPKADPKAKRSKLTILATAFVFDIKPKELGIKEFAEKEMQIRDLVKSYLRNRTIVFFKDPKTEEEIKRQLLKRINRKLKNSEIIKVYIPDFILN